MRLLKPDPGELADRQTILELKIEHLDKEIVDAEPVVKGRGPIIRTVVEGGDKKVGAHHFFDELEMIQKHLRQNWIPDLQMIPGKVEEYDKLYDELTEINSDLWSLEDQARILRSAPDKSYNAVLSRKSEILDAITAQNDKRSEIVKKINALWNITSEEKMYS